MEDNFIFPATLCLIAGLILIVVSIFLYRKYAKEIKSFKTNAYKIDAEVVGYSYSGDAETVGYSPEYMYNHPSLGSIKLTSSSYTNRKPKIGKTKTIYYNPTYPFKYYNSKLDVYNPTVPVLVIGLMFVCGGIVFMFA